MQERNLCSQSNPYRYLCRQEMLHINQKEIEGPNMKILSLQKKSMKMIILLILSLFTGNQIKLLKNWNLFTHEALSSSYELVQMRLCISDRIGIWKCWFLRRGESQSNQRKTSRSKEENQQQTQPTYKYGFDAENWTRATMVGGECFHHCPTLAPRDRIKKLARATLR